MFPNLKSVLLIASNESFTGHGIIRRLYLFWCSGQVLGVKDCRSLVTYCHLPGYQLFVKVSSVSVILSSAIGHFCFGNSSVK